MDIVARLFDPEKSTHPHQNCIYLLCLITLTDLFLCHQILRRRVYDVLKSPQVFAVLVLSRGHISIVKGKANYSLGLGFCDQQDYF